MIADNWSLVWDIYFFYLLQLAVSPCNVSVIKLLCSQRSNKNTAPTNKLGPTPGGHKAKFFFETIHHIWNLKPDLVPPKAPPTLGRQCARFSLRGRALEWCCGERSCPIARLVRKLSNTSHLSLYISGRGYSRQDSFCYPRMRGNKKGTGGRLSSSASRRPSYPADQWLNQAKSSTKVWVKVVMGIAYFLCVSVAAFFLAVYYVFFWTPVGPNSTIISELNKSLDCGGKQAPAGK